MPFYQKLIIIIIVLSFFTLWVKMYLMAYYGKEE